MYHTALQNIMAFEAEESEEIVTPDSLWDEKYARGISYAGANFGRLSTYHTQSV